MNVWQRILRVIVLVLGIAGTVGCVYVIVSFWNVKSEIGDVADSVFERVDESLDIVSGRIEKVQERVEGAKITIEKIGQKLKDWGVPAAVDRLKQRLDISGKSATVASILEQADEWMEVARSTVLMSRQALQVGSSLGLKLEGKSLDGVVEEIDKLRAKLAEATQFVVEIRNRTAESGDEETLGERMKRLAPTAFNVIATIGTVDTHLARLADKLTETHQNIGKLETKVRQRVQSASRYFTLIMIWMALGQIALCIIGAKGLCCSSCQVDKPAE